MQNDEVSDEIFDRAEPDNTTRPRSRKKHLLISVQAVTFLAGLGLLIFLIYKTGYTTILDSMSRVGWGFLFIVGLNISRHLLRAASLYMAITPEHRTFGYRKVAAARFGGEAVNFFSFVGPFLGDAAKAVLLRKDLALTHGASAVITDNILYYLSVVLMILAGVVTLVLVYGSSGRAMTDVLAVIVIGAVLLLVLPMLAVKYKIKPATKAMNFLLDRRMLPQFIAKGHQSILDVETNVLDFYHKRRRDFFLVFGISVGVHVLSVIEVFLAMRFLGYDAPVSTAFIIESLTKVINAVFGFIPGTMGAYEGGNVLILSASGYTAAAGISLALVRRGAILISTLIGLMVLLSRTAGRKKRLSNEKNN
jgi:glycosyltransferase 2 family protein